MKAVILAAGMGRRLSSMGWEKPKCLLPVGGTTLLGHVLESLIARGVREAVIVVGYRRGVVEREASRFDISCTFVENADFSSTNTMYSLFLAREFLTGDFLYFNADVWFDAELLDLLIGVGQVGMDGVLVLDEKTCGDEEVKMILDDRGRVLQIGKALDPAECAGEFIGIGRFNHSICSALIVSLGRFCFDRAEHGGAGLGHDTQGGRSLFFEAAVDDLLGDFRVMTVPLGELRAVEIDTAEDYALAKGMIG